VFTARYALSPYTQQTRLVFKKLMFKFSVFVVCVCVFHTCPAYCPLLFMSVILFL
jgi:hypothetical protein